VKPFHRLVLAGLLVAAFPAARVLTETLVETSMDAGIIVDMHVSDSALQALVPPGITLNVATQGGQKDVNLQLVFLDRMTLQGADGKPLGKTGSNRLIYLAALIKDPAGTNSGNSRLMVGGLSEDPAEAPGPLGVYLPATMHTMTRTTTGSTGPTVDTQDWNFAAASGEHVEMHIKYERLPGINKPRPADFKFYSAKNPSFFQLSRQERATEIVRQIWNNPPDRVKEFSLKASGGSYTKLFDENTKVIELANVPWMSRSVLVP
jgi:hypothetical protein